MMELLSPAGGMEQLRAAARFGADAVYGGLKKFGLRAAAGKDDAAVYVAGDARTGSSLVVNAMADALKCAAEVAGDLGL